MPLEHWMTFATFSEQEFFVYPNQSAYHGIILNANMVAHAPAGIAAFLLGKVDPNACYLIDPMTHAFQHSPETISNEKGPKSSIKKLASCYGDFVSSQLGVRPLDAATVAANVVEFTKNVVDFQWSHLECHFKNSSDAKYLEGDVVKYPAIVIAPYFYLTEGGAERWLPVMANAARAAVEYADTFEQTTKVYSALVFERALLQRIESVNRLHSAISDCDLNGVLLWVDEFDETSASSVELEGLARLCTLLRESRLEVLNLHGGYFSCLLGSEAFGRRFTGVSHGPEFGESRGVVPVGGGIPISRFYVPDLHLRAKFRDFLPVALAKEWLTDADAFHAHVCACKECLHVISGDVKNFELYGESDVKSIQRKNGVVRIEFPTTDAKKRCLKHYLNRKCEEYSDASRLNREEILSALERAHTKFYGVESHESLSHLLKWKGVLQALG